MEQLSILSTKYATGIFFSALPSSLGSGAEHSATALPSSNALESLIIRNDYGDPHKRVNVFDGDGNKRYTIERISRVSKQWHLYAEPQHQQVASMDIGMLGRSVGMHNENTFMKFNSGVLGKLHRHFYDANGDLFSWNRRSQFLERICNPAGKHEEQRSRVAYIHQLRRNRFDYQLLVDPMAICIVKALATAFVTLKTQWPTYNWASPSSTPPILGSGKKESHAPNGHPEGNFVNNSISKLLVYIDKEPDPMPRNFFDPPEFIQNKIGGF